MSCEKRLEKPKYLEQRSHAGRLGLPKGLDERELTTGARNNLWRGKNGSKPRGRPKKTKHDLAGAKVDSATAQEAEGRAQEPARERAQRTSPLSPARKLLAARAPPVAQSALSPSRTSSQQQQQQQQQASQTATSAQDGPNAHDVADLSSGFKRNEVRVEIGKRRRGRPVGSKNKPKPDLDGMKPDLAAGEQFLDSNGKVVEESPAGNDGDDIIVSQFK